MERNKDISVCKIRLSIAFDNCFVRFSFGSKRVVTIS